MGKRVITKRIGEILLERGIITHAQLEKALAEQPRHQEFHSRQNVLRGKVAQILRNFISNALKFTERGEVRVSATLAPAGDAVVFSVADTGIGIAPEDQEWIFQEFSQVEHPIQKRVRGSGLGLPLATRLAELLGGRVFVESQRGVGSTFSAVIPVFYVERAPAPVTTDRIAEPDPTAREGAAVVLQAVTRARTAPEDARG